MLRTALRNVLAHKARLIMTALAVLLGVAFVSGTLIFSSTLNESLRNQSARSLKDVAVSVTATGARVDAGDEPAAVDDGLVETIRQLPGVRFVRPTVNGFATVADKDKQPLSGSGLWAGLAANYAPGQNGEDSRYPVREGRGPAAEGEIALAAKTAADGGYRVGDTVLLATGEHPVLTKKLVGIVDTDDLRVATGGTLTLFDTATAQKLLLSPGRYDELMVAAKPGVDSRALTETVRQALPEEGVEATSGPTLAAEQAKQIAEENNAMTSFLLVFAGIALFVGSFIIANTFTMLVAQRSREIALLRAIGASRRQVVRSVLVEAGLLGLVSAAIGFVLGIGIAVGLRSLLNAAFEAGLPEGPVVIGVDAVVASLAVGVLVTVLAAWLPSRKAAKIAPVEALSTIDAAPKTRGLLVRNTIGVLLTGLGAAIMTQVSTSSDMFIALFGGLLVMTGLILLAPLLSRPIVSLAGQLTGRVFGLPGKLSTRNALRNPRRTAATASALMIGLTLVTGLTVVGHSEQEGLDKMSTQGLVADYRVSQTDGVLPADSTEKTAEVPGVKTAVPLNAAFYEADNTVGTLVGTDPEALGETVNLTFRSGSLADVGTGRIAISQETAQDAGWHTGDTVRLGFDAGGQERELKIVGIYEDTPLLAQALGTFKDVAPHVDSAEADAVDSLLVTAESGKSAGLDKDIRSALGNSPLLKIQDKGQLQQESAEDITTFLNLMYGLLGMAIVIAVLGVINTLAMSVFERTREIGMLRAIGLARTGIRQMICLESIVICFFGAALGLGAGIFLASAGSAMLADGFPTYETMLPWGKLGLFMLLALAVGVLAAVWPARSAARLNMLRSINTQ